MKKCKVGGVEVDPGLIRSGSKGFGRALSPETAIPFKAEIDGRDAVADFGPYYQEFIARESEDEGFEEVLEGLYLLLKETGYLSFEKMISEQPALLAMVIKDELPAEFLGYVFLDRNAALESKKYILQNLTNVDIADGKIVCDGYAFLNPKYPS
jgi:hypothetical protein